MKLDAHQHFWSLQRENDYGFLTPEAGVLYRDYAPDELAPLLAAHGIQYSIAVQAAETVQETLYLLELAERHEFVAGVVGWIDLEADSDSFMHVWNQLRQHRKFVGIRPMLQDLPDDRWILQPNVLENLRTLAAEQFPFDMLVYPRHLPYIAEMLEAVPGLRAVVDHAAKPPIRSGWSESWATWMRQISRFPHVWCKLSGMVTEADLQHWKPDDLAPYVDVVLDCFGPERVMFGSDWPVCLLAASYGQVYTTAEQLLRQRLDAAACEAVFGANAARFYNITDGKGR